ncbi:uncharacterized protein L969DRAFT_86717 [Mixia osmundae IAM 14324]|uniref:Aromatic amino acid beta-eliminating lyase/threonine aldolase domain-containing protein n=1 Tax=Mixia osmundae (strain CBS 9802 / IAM 14324 / JCM 22182 / KY 12970) TaxID=764103 RepID=G7E9Y7_MIXOS|nr:uncharacterized protein L969DRAFT_86717 [Mixia osmundae IAM 14324]KEI40090.1 hypothetical protein L969DRAFT_86717 [Mixia osmundae IAM 14324]GAA99456.1 hypothetical protein E5Q_06155 [Mixia osmundae IAM 14324]
MVSTEATSSDARRAQEAKLRRDFRTDTITFPTDEVFELMRQATRGDDVYSEDATTLALQERIANLAGKERALFCVSGTLSNQLGIRSHLKQPPHSVLCDVRAHVYKYEAGGIAFHSQAQTITVKPSNGHHLRWSEDIAPNLLEEDDIHYAPVRLICLENTLMGTIFPLDEVRTISQEARRRGILMHCDGARIWEVVAKTGLPLSELLEPFDSISVCMSKGLGAPVGSLLIGAKPFIDTARRFRKLFGGGIRQSGSLAVAAQYGLDFVLPQLSRAHSYAERIATELQSLGVRLIVPTETNMVWIDPTPLGFGLDVLDRRAADIDITLGGSRIVISFQTDEQAVTDLIDLVTRLKKEYAGSTAEHPIQGQQQTLSGEHMAIKRKGVPYSGN